MNGDLDFLQEAVSHLRAVHENSQQAGGEIDLGSGETCDRFELSGIRVSHAALENSSEALRGLLRAGFTLRLVIELFGRRITLRLWPGTPVTYETEGHLPDPPDAAEDHLPWFNKLRGRLDHSDARSFEALLPPLAPPPGADVAFSLSVVIDKGQILSQLAPARPPGSARLFLFARSLIRLIAETSFTELEDPNHPYGLLAERGHIDILVLDLGKSRLNGDFLHIYGPDIEDEIFSPIDPGKQAALHDQAEEVVSFRNRECLWTKPTRWLVPEVFAVRVFPADTVGEAEARRSERLHRELETSKVLLATICLGSRIRTVDPPADGTQYYELLFTRTAHHRDLALSRSAVAEHRQSHADVWSLYRFAYEGRTRDKLEIVRRTLDHWSRDAASLFEHAGQALGAAVENHSRYLLQHVAEYFETKRQMQDYVQSVLLEMETTTLSLTREVTENAYKTVGIIVAAALAGLLEPEISQLAAAFGSLLVALYMAVNLWYYMPGLMLSWAIRRQQFRSRMHAFAEILDDREINKLIRGPRIRRAQSLFLQKARHAKWMYLGLFLVAILLCALFGRLLLTEPPTFVH